VISCYLFVKCFIFVLFVHVFFLCCLCN